MLQIKSKNLAASNL